MEVRNSSPGGRRRTAGHRAILLNPTFTIKAVRCRPISDMLNTRFRMPTVIFVPRSGPTVPLLGCRVLRQFRKLSLVTVAGDGREPPTWSRAVSHIFKLTETTTRFVREIASLSGWRNTSNPHSARGFTRMDIEFIPSSLMFDEFAVNPSLMGAFNFSCYAIPDFDFGGALDFISGPMLGFHPGPILNLDPGLDPRFCSLFNFQFQYHYRLRFRCIRSRGKY
ncbi:hypothetical protein EVAR_16076_1 [Eumeta japonica]|uniref:Uncharacterized protein n=1 Tax=Eumeta variegata TaxID=151549 RepID=A0A4C1UIH1_EUMVA|nr:hypothetical protein EVAR_16076_1 [Eumeta japonica]